MLLVLMFIVGFLALIGLGLLSQRWAAIKEIESHWWNRREAARLIVDANRYFESNFGEDIRPADIESFKREDRWLRQRAEAPTRRIFGGEHYEYALSDNEQQAMRLVIEKDHDAATLEYVNRTARSTIDQPLG